MIIFGDQMLITTKFTSLLMIDWSEKKQFGCRKLPYFPPQPFGALSGWKIDSARQVATFQVTDAIFARFYIHFRSLQV